MVRVPQFMTQITYDVVEQIGYPYAVYAARGVGFLKGPASCNRRATTRGSPRGCGTGPMVRMTVGSRCKMTH